MAGDGGRMQALFQLDKEAEQVAVARDGNLVVGVRWGLRSQASTVCRWSTPATARCSTRSPTTTYVRWSLSQDRRVAVIAAPGNIEVRPSDVLVWRLGTPVTDIQRVPTGGEVTAIAACGAEVRLRPHRPAARSAAGPGPTVRRDHRAMLYAPT